MKPVELCKHRIKGYCQAKGCTRRVKYGTLCSTCRSRKSRLADLERYAYNTLHSNATRRNKEFTLTLGYFRKVCVKSQYIAGKGRSSYSLTVDRIREDLGHHDYNIQVIPNADNIRKRYLEYDWRTGTATVRPAYQTTDSNAWSE